MKFQGDEFSKDVADLLTEKMEESEIVHDYIEIEMPDELTILLHGEIYSELELKKLREILMEHTAAEEIDEEDIIVVETNYDNDEDSGSDDYVSDEISPLKEDFAGTEDIYRSLEDGIPYIPPMENPEDGVQISKKAWLKKKKKS